MNPSSLVTTASSRILQHWRCLLFMLLWNLDFIWPDLETYPSDVTKSPIQKCSKTLICNSMARTWTCFWRYFFLLGREEFQRRTSFILFPESLRDTQVAMITKHSNESARHYCFHGDGKAEACGEVMEREWPRWSRSWRKIRQIYPGCLLFCFWLWTTLFRRDQNGGLWIMLMTSSCTRELISQ